MKTSNYKFYRHYAGTLTPALIVLLFSTADAHSQAVPADLLDLSLDDLLAMEVRESDSASGPIERPWTFSYSYQSSRFDDYLDGTTKVSVDDVLFSPGQEPRTKKNFPVVPTDIHQEAHSLSLTYHFSSDFSLTLAAPHIKQSTDHISTVPGYSSFTISSQGIGDTTLVGNWRFKQTISGRWQAGAGLSLPTGSIDEIGDTPRAAGDQQLPYTMQHGSGTVDVPAYIAYHGTQYAFDWGFGLAGKLRLGENDRGYTLGDRLSASTWLRLTTLKYIQPSLKLNYRYWEEISGNDPSLSVPGPFPYPAPVVAPKLFGGEIADLTVAVRLPLMSPHRHMDLEFSKPVYQSLNGPQSSEDYRIAAHISFEF